MPPWLRTAAQKLVLCMPDQMPVLCFPPVQVTGQADGVGLVLSVESKDAAALEAAAKDLEAALEPGMLSAKLSDNDFLGANGA